MDDSHSVFLSTNRDFSVECLKALATLLIINSHIDCCYGNAKILATGGAIGDALFLFCSGYALFLGANRSFFNYIKRRIRRIYPSVFASLIAMIALGEVSLQNFSTKTFFGGEFVIAIMMYYPILYIVRTYLKKMWLNFAIVISVTIVAYYFFPYKYEVGEKGLYGITTLFRWIPYFGFMLLGAYIGQNKYKLSFEFKRDFFKMSGSLFIFYLIQFLAKKYSFVAPWQIVTIPFLGLIVFYLFKLFNAPCMQYIRKNTNSVKVILVISGVCLESYLIQGVVITNRFNFLFPFNIPMMFAMVLIVSYVVRCLARFLLQTFDSCDYDWKCIFKI